VWDDIAAEFEASGAAFGVVVDPGTGVMRTLQRMDRAVNSGDFVQTGEAVCDNCGDASCATGLGRTVSLTLNRTTGSSWVRVSYSATRNWTPVLETCGTGGTCPIEVDASGGPVELDVRLDGTLTTCSAFSVFFDTDDRSPYDEDGDGFEIGADCDDADQATSPDSTEDRNNVSDDCDVEIDEGIDEDGDGFFWYDECNDLDPDINPGQTNLESIDDDIDNDCDGLVDDDFDGDLDGFTPAQGDCDDDDPLFNPGMPEDVLDDIDNDCDGNVDEDVDDDGDGFTLADSDCDDDDPAVNPGSANPNLDCDVDDDGAPSVLFILGRQQVYDCNDTDATISPEVTLDGPTANGIDNDCDTVVDEDADDDGDGFTPAEGDCDDSDASIRPNASEILGDLLDSDCSGDDLSVRSDHLGVIRYAPAGTFDMGCHAMRDTLGGALPCVDRWTPPHAVELTRPFWVMRTEVTQEQYQLIVGGTPSFHDHFTPNRLPVEQVSWADAVAFANAVNALEGRPQCAGSPDPYTCTGWRLPTEAEWEYAARGGEDQVYSGSDMAAAVATYSGTSADVFGRPPRLRTRDVCDRAPNAWGLCDMSGNVWEWTSDYEAGFDHGLLVDPIGPSSGNDRVARGGSFKQSASLVRAASRWGTPPSTISDEIGFRLVRTLATDVDHDGDGFTPDEGDCDPADPTRNPSADESTPNGIDDDCDGDVDEDV
jgi:formylglycine-generating enzyme required for sulfatase activity